MKLNHFKVRLIILLSKLITNLTLSEKYPKIEIGSYQRLIGKLLYLSHTWPDISYPVNVLIQFMRSPQKSHYHAALRVLRYLKGTVGLGITPFHQFFPNKERQGFPSSDNYFFPPCKLSISLHFHLLFYSHLQAIIFCQEFIRDL